MSDDQDYVFSATDCDRIAAAVVGYETTYRPQAGIARKAKAFYGSASRAMIIDDTYPVYSPRDSRKVALFQISPETNQTTVRMFGCDLSGYIVLTIAGDEFTVPCTATNVQLRTALNLGRTCRVTAFPGTWEFAWRDRVLDITARPGNGFYGGLLVQDELWVSMTDDDEEPYLVDCVDSIPFIEGEVKRGALSIAQQYGHGTYLAAYWRDPGFNFAAGVG